MKVAFIYAGQGQQFQNMGVDLASKYTWAFDVFSKASDILGYDLLEIIKSDLDKLNQTQYTQPALFVTDYLLGTYLIKNNVVPEMVAGLSLGEYNALNVAEVISFEDALNILKVRAKLMQNAFEVGKTKMAAILKADVALIEEILNKPELNNEVAICNYNTSQQVVIGGYTNSLEKAIELLKENGVKRVIELDVSCVSHMHLLTDASLVLKDELEKYEYNVPSIKFINNTQGIFQESGFVDSLTNHIAKPTYLAKSIELMLDNGITHFIEVGPKKTISSFIKSVAKEKNKDVAIFNVYDIETLDNTIKELGE